MMPEKEERPPAPPRVSTVEVRPGYYSTVLYCQFPDCTKTVQVELTAQGVAYPVDTQPFDAQNTRFFVRDYLRQNGLPFSECIHLLSKDLYPLIEKALRQGDPGALFELDREYAPFYCRICHCVYCYQHMHYEEVWDEDYIVGGVDYWKGMCPYGHKQFVDH